MVAPSSGEDIERRGYHPAGQGLALPAQRITESVIVPRSTTLLPGAPIGGAIMSEERYIRGLPSEVKPSVKMMVPCLRIEPHEELNSVSLIGLLPVVQADEFPVVFPDVYVYAVIVDALGNYDFWIDFVPRRDEEVTSRATFPGIHVPDRRIMLRVEFHFEGLRLSRPGAYDFRLYANGEYLESATIALVRSGSGG